ncbi:hypothetical protein [Rhizorhabdus dicambivorans]|uniref:Uncharacterized protein n=1 Tax=Rhizorhabdus dicambivorans TaxID=1850238 RepID=A0A2A4FXP6_9SPHN|nr:hypothetical protein [Rhizorhabdus dicambivorans]ATE67085.1 hypothetical protein CMV14_02160 [Rhizorhabdus dicambivorans]PCE43564.1 hypothetical protein COO09_04480 [Rhizorhabdus dicambivorans]
MTKSAAEVMHEVILSAVIDGLGALRTASKGVPNAMLRDIGAIHLNTTFQDLPADLQASIQSSVRAAFTRLQSEGYTVLNPKVAGTNRPPQPAPRAPKGPARGHVRGGRPPRQPRPEGGGRPEGAPPKGKPPQR